MIFLIGTLSLLGAALIFPGWIWSKSNQPATLWIMALPLGGMLFWIMLTAFGVGAQSLANLVELIPIAVSAVLAAYLKIFFLDMRQFGRGRSSLMAVGVVALVAFGLRIFMPVLPE